MRRFTARGLVGFALLSIATCAPVLAASTSAPADEYFGRYHLSILGIRNALTDMTVQAHEQPERAATFFKSAELTEDSIRQWQSRYPHDEWLPKMVFSLERLYVTIGTPESAERAIHTSAWLDQSFPHTEFAQMGHTELASLSTTDDGNASTADSPAMLGMVPALSDTTVPPTADTQGSAPAASAAIASNSGDSAASAVDDGPAQTTLPSYAQPDDAYPAALGNAHSVDIWVQK